VCRKNGSNFAYSQTFIQIGITAADYIEGQHLRWFFDHIDLKGVVFGSKLERILKLFQGFATHLLAERQLLFSRNPEK